MARKKNTGFIGLGNIGKPMARHLVGESFQLTVYDVFEPATAELSELGASVAASVAELASCCSYVGICVRDEADVESVLNGDQGLLANLAPDSVVAIHSTVTQQALLQWAEDAQVYSCRLIDAPITGGAHKAESGDLCYMVGGDAETLAMCRPMFETSADKIVHAGELGAGIALKLCNNLIQYMEFLAMSEATRLANACGLSADVLREVGMSNAVVNEQMHMFVSGRDALAANSDPQQMEAFFGAMGRLGRKDLQCALDTAQAHALSLPATRYTRDVIEDVFLARDG